VVFSNGKQLYSNTVSLRNNNFSMPSLAGNVVAAKATVNSPSVFDYTVTDLGGRTMAKGKILQGVNVLDLSGFTKGLYLIHYSNGSEQSAEKFMKQ
jgi:hypothetical protein